MPAIELFCQGRPANFFTGSRCRRGRSEYGTHLFDQMKQIDYTRLLTHARLLHTDLRGCLQSTGSDAERRALYQVVKRNLEALNADGANIGRVPDVTTIFRATQELIFDALYHAGMAENRFLEAEEVEQRYGLLVESVKGSSNLA